MAKTSGAQPGNDNAKRGMEVRESLRRSLCKLGMKVKVDHEDEHGEPYPNDDDLTNYQIGMDSVTDDMLIGERGSRETFTVVADRTDGKPAQSVELTGAGGNPIEMAWTVEVIEPDVD